MRGCTSRRRGNPRHSRGCGNPARSSARTITLPAPAKWSNSVRVAPARCPTTDSRVADRGRRQAHRQDDFRGSGDTRRDDGAASRKRRQPARRSRRVRDERVVGRALDRASSSNARSAAFTDASLGNALDTAGSMTTTFDSVLMRLEYLPRTIGPRSLRLYSGRSQSFASDLGFFIDFPFCARRQPRTYDSNRISVFRVRNRK